MHRFLPRLLALVAVPALATPPNTDAEVRAFATEWLATWNAYDADALLDLMADGAVLAWPDGSTETVTDRAAALDAGREFFAYASAQNIHIDAEIESVYTHGGMAVVFLRGTMDSDSMDETPVHLQLTLVRLGEAWKMAAEHSMAIQP